MSKRVWAFLCPEDFVEVDSVMRLQEDLWRQQEFIFQELEESRQQCQELVSSLSEMIYVARYSPNKKSIEKLANEKDALFHPLLSSPLLRKSNKRKLSLLLESVKPPRQEREALVQKRLANTTFGEKRPCRVRVCHTCDVEKQTKCFEKAYHICNACYRRKDFSRVSSSSTNRIERNEPFEEA